MIFHKLVRIKVETMILARNSHKKSSINVVVANRKAWSTYHYMLDHIVSLLIFTSLNLIGLDAATASQPSSSHSENCEWIGFS